MEITIKIVLETGFQILINSLISGLLLSLVALGFAFIFSITKVFHLAHGGIYVTGGMIFWWIITLSNNWLISVILALISTLIITYIIEKTIYLPISRKRVNQSISLIASMGLYIVIINALALAFGNENKQIANPISGSYEFGEIILTKVQIIQTITGVIAILFFYAYLKVTKSNLIFQSISDSEIVSKVFGINTESERLKVFLIGSTLACTASILKTLEVGVDPQSGMGITLTAAVVAILVSRLNISLIVCFSILLTLLQNSIEWFLDAQWKNGITFFILLLVILFRTEGIISYNLRKDRA